MKYPEYDSCLCSKCQQEPKEEHHPCAYMNEVRPDLDEGCDCCKSCQEQCNQEV